MDLQTYLFLNKIRKKDFAYELGISCQSFYQILGGSARPGKTLSMFIEHLTDGKVTFFELRGEKKAKRPKD